MINTSFVHLNLNPDIIRIFDYPAREYFKIAFLNENFSYLSGNGLLINDGLSNFGTKFQGSFVLIRIPVGNFKTDFNWAEFVE